MILDDTQRLQMDWLPPYTSSYIITSVVIKLWISVVPNKIVQVFDKTI